MVWQDGDLGTTTNGPEQIIPPAIELDDEIIDGSKVEETTYAHEVMVVIAPWIVPFLAYFIGQDLPNSQAEARRIIRCSKAYKVHEGELYKKSYWSPTTVHVGNRGAVTFGRDTCWHGRPP